MRTGVLIVAVAMVLHGGAFIWFCSCAASKAETAPCGKHAQCACCAGGTAHGACCCGDAVEERQAAQINGHVAAFQPCWCLEGRTPSVPVAIIPELGLQIERPALDVYAGIPVSGLISTPAELAAMERPAAHAPPGEALLFNCVQIC